MTSLAGGDGHRADHDDETAALVAAWSEDSVVRVISGHDDDEAAALIAAACAGEAVQSAVSSADQAAPGQAGGR